MIGVRQAGEADLAGIAAVALACGQPPTDSGADPAYARHLLAHGTLMAAVDRERHVVGFGATRRVGSASVLTDLFVLPDRQGGGIGGAILRCLWDADAETRITFSSQDPRALPLYVRFGLRPRWPLLYLRGSAASLEADGLHVRRVAAGDAAAVERDLTGIDRGADYAYWLRSDPARALVVHDHDDRPVAAGAATAAGLAHLVCPSAALATDALVAALLALGEEPQTLWVPGPHPALPLLLRNQFVIEDYDIHMSSDDAFAGVTSVYSPALA